MALKRMITGSYHSADKSDHSTAAIRIPRGVFHGDVFSKFSRKAPNAVYRGVDPNGRHIWIERFTCPEYGKTATIALSCDDRGQNGEAWMIDPDLKGHSLGMHTIHCYESGQICIDKAGVNRELPQVRALAILWWSYFLKHLDTGKPVPTERL